MFGTKTCDIWLIGTLILSIANEKFEKASTTLEVA